VAITLISLLISGYYYFRTQPELSRGRRWMLFLLRSVSLFILLLLLVSPILYYIKNITQKQQVILLEDVSASMDLASLDLPKSEFLKPYGKELAAKFSAAGYELHEYEFAAGLETETSNTLLSPALTELAKMHDFSRVKGILLVSDGWLKDESLSQVRQLGCPFHVLADTLRPQRSDLAVKKTITNRQAYRNEPTIIRAEIASENYNGPAWSPRRTSGSRMAPHPAWISPIALRKPVSILTAWKSRRRGSMSAPKTTTHTRARSRS